jgi:hypothetical protein
MGGLGDLLFGTEGSLEQFSTLSPEQQQIQQALLPILKKLLEEGRTPYSGERVAELTGKEQDVLGGLSNLLKSSGPALERLLSGQVPEEYFEKTIKAPLLRTYKEDILPLAEEGLVGRGTFSGEPLLRMRKNLMSRAFETLGAERGKLAQTAFEAPGKYLQSVTAGYAGAGAQFAKERLISQQKLDTAYQEYLRTEPGGAEALNFALQFLGIQTMGYVQQPGQEGIMGDLIAMMGNVGGGAMSMLPFLL